MGTTYEVIITELPGALARADIQSMLDEQLADVDRHLSGWNEASEVARFNATESTDWVPVSPVLLRAVAQSLVISRESAGAFDVTVGPLVGAWGFGADADVDLAAPTASEIARLQASVGHDKLELRAQPPALRKRVPALRIDLDGVAPGLAVDDIAARLEALGVRDYLVELGGEVRARGRSPAGRPWRVAVEAPVAGERRAYALVELDGVGVSTSGDYRDFHDADGRRISHTIDPRSAAPVSHGLASVSVVHESVAAADAWCTALMVLGPQEGMALARRLGLAALFIERRADGRLVESASPAFGRFRRPLPGAL